MKSLSCMKYKEMFPLSPAFIQMNVTTFSWNDYTHLNKRVTNKRKGQIQQGYRPYVYYLTDLLI